MSWILELYLVPNKFENVKDFSKKPLWPDLFEKHTDKTFIKNFYAINNTILKLYRYRQIKTTLFHCFIQTIIKYFIFNKLLQDDHEELAYREGLKDNV